MPKTKVRDLMTTKVITVPPEAIFKEVVEKLMIYDISSVPVVEEDGTLVGIVTEADLMTKEALGSSHRPRLIALLADLLGGRSGHAVKKAEARTAQELMTAHPTTASPEEAVRRAAKRMIRKGVKRLPVIVDGKLVGIISRHDVLDVFDRPDADLKDAIDDHIERCLYVEPHADVRVAVDDGVVTLTGTVRFESDVRIVENIVAGMDGVVGVDNRLAFHEAEHRMPNV